MKNKTGTPIQCHKCGYGWLTQSQMFFVQCPRCRTNVRLAPQFSAVEQTEEFQALKRLFGEML